MEKQSAISPLVVSLSFKWYNRHAGLTFGRDIFTDPIKRTDTLRECARIAFEHFGDVGLGQHNPQPSPIASHSYGDRFMSALFGCEVVYFNDQAPCVVAKEADFDEMAGLQVPDLGNNEVVQKMLSDAELLRRHYGCVSGSINTGSPANVAVSLYGQDFLIACALEPEIAQHVLHVIGETIYKLDREVCAVAEPESFPQSPVSMGYGNCPAIMFSPSMYRDVLLPVDKWFRSQVRDFHLHHCGVFDKYIDLYKELDPATIDVGGGSDYRALRKAFPNTPCSFLINTGDVEGLSAREIDAFVADMVERASPRELITRIACVDLSESVPDDTVRALATVHERI